MIFFRNLQKITPVAITCVVISCTINTSVFAATPHENPETAKQVFSLVSLLQYCSETLDFTLKGEPEELEARLGKLRFANVPPELEEAINSFGNSNVSLSYLIASIEEYSSRLRTLVSQYRFEEATQLTDEIYSRLSQGNYELARGIEEATGIIGRWFKLPSAPEGSSLKKAYNEVLEKIERIRDVLNLYEEILPNTLQEAIPVEVLNPTSVTLKVEPVFNFVGDNIHFRGMLTSARTGLSRRKIDILLNGSPILTVTTEASGYYQGTLQVPYQYIPEMDLQALYYPRDEDTEYYISSLSPVVKLAVSYYETKLEAIVEDKAYPGLETVVTGKFDYGGSPLPRERKVEIYIDDVLTAEVSAVEAFSQKIELSPELDVGKHIITVSAGPAGKYAPVVASTTLNVTRATPIFDINTPTVAMVPGRINLGGKLYSEVGPLSGALVRMGLGKSQVELVSSEDGTFETEIRVGMGFGWIGSEGLEIQVVPQEPWHSALTTTRNIVVINMVNCGGILIILILLGIFLPGRLGLRVRAYLWRRARPTVAIAQPEPAPAYLETVLSSSLLEESNETAGELRARIFYWYRLTVRLAQRITNALLKPQQTLREFTRETGRALGPATEYFLEFTRMVERLLYSRHGATEEDVERSKQLSNKIEEGLKGEGF